MSPTREEELETEDSYIPPVIDTSTSNTPFLDAMRSYEGPIAETRAKLEELGARGGDESEMTREQAVGQAILGLLPIAVGAAMRGKKGVLHGMVGAGTGAEAYSESSERDKARKLKEQQLERKSLQDRLSNLIKSRNAANESHIKQTTIPAATQAQIDATRENTRAVLAGRRESDRMREEGRDKDREVRWSRVELDYQKAKQGYEIAEEKLKDADELIALKKLDTLEGLKYKASLLALKERAQAEKERAATALEDYRNRGLEQRGEEHDDRMGLGYAGLKERGREFDAGLAQRSKEASGRLELGRDKLKQDQSQYNSTLGFKKEEAQRNQGNKDRDYDLKVKESIRKGDLENAKMLAKQEMEKRIAARMDRQLDIQERRADISEKRQQTAQGKLNTDREVQYRKLLQLENSNLDWTTKQPYPQDVRKADELTSYYNVLRESQLELYESIKQHGIEYFGSEAGRQRLLEAQGIIAAKGVHGMGANFTLMEKGLIDSLLGGSGILDRFKRQITTQDALAVLAKSIEQNQDIYTETLAGMNAYVPGLKYSKIARGMLGSGVPFDSEGRAVKVGNLKRYRMAAFPDLEEKLNGAPVATASANRIVR